MTRNILIKLSFLVFVSAFGVQSSLACMYGPPFRTVCATYAQADAVIIGKVASVKGDRVVQTVVINVARTFKGRKETQVVVWQEQSNCDWDFSKYVGESLLLYLVRDPNTKMYSAIAEGMGGPIKTQSENLYWLNNLPKSLNRTRLSGEVQLDNKTLDLINNVARVKVRVFNASNSFEVFTDKNGVYQIWDIPAGKYQVESVLPDKLELRLNIERGLIDFESLKQINPNTERVLVEIQPKGCGGIDFVVIEKRSKHGE